MSKNNPTRPPYFLHKIDSDGCVHSIDRLVVDYWLCRGDEESAVDELADLYDRIVPEFDRNKTYYLGRGRKASNRYDWFCHFLQGGGIACRVGQYTDYDKETKQFHRLPIVRVDFNPNKRHGTPLHDALFDWLDSNCTSGVIQRLDYAVDIPCTLSKVRVESRKKAGLYEGTQYYGKRHTHCALRVYDKAEEVGSAFVKSLDRADRAEARALVTGIKAECPLTRCEWTIKHSDTIHFDDVTWLTSGPQPVPDVNELDTRTLSLVQLCRIAMSSGADPMECLSVLDKRTVKKIEPFTIGRGKKLVCGFGPLFCSLVDLYCSAYSISASFGEVKAGGTSFPAFTIGTPSFHKSRDVDLVPADDDEELPF